MTTQTMSVAERFRCALRGAEVDRLPVMEWATWWDQTILRWHSEGLSPTLDHAGIKRALGLDVDHQLWCRQVPADLVPAQHGAGIIADAADYAAKRGRLYRHDSPLIKDADAVAQWRLACAERAAGQALCWLTFDGFFWWPRVLLGIEPHLYAFSDQADLLHQICDDQCRHIAAWLEQVCAIGAPDFVTFAEDMSYNLGPMLSKRQFDTFLAPYYRRILPLFQQRGIPVLCDSDGDVAMLASWLSEVGFDGVLPLERQAGCDINNLQANNPSFAFLGHFDKMVMNQGEQALQCEFERLAPAMARGRFIPSVDHQTPPSVSLTQYRQYVGLLRDYASGMPY
ncbi:MAG: hypothetical protein PF961_02935 [Planctomycetota bacterium]|jgi:hypothetical protein|nr:hypothetical protein [Planctomycetota bacterium]